MYTSASTVMSHIPLNDVLNETLVQMQEGLLWYRYVLEMIIFIALVTPLTE